MGPFNPQLLTPDFDIVKGSLDFTVAVNQRYPANPNRIAIVFFSRSISTITVAPWVPVDTSDGWFIGNINQSLTLLYRDLGGVIGGEFNLLCGALAGSVTILEVIYTPNRK